MLRPCILSSLMGQSPTPMQVIPSAWLRLFNPKEVNELLSGGEGGGVDAEDMQRHATYSGGYSADSQTIRLFWKVESQLLLM